MLKNIFNAKVTELLNNSNNFVQYFILLFLKKNLICYESDILR